VSNTYGSALRSVSFDHKHRTFFSKIACNLLVAGLAAVCLASIGSVFLPATAVRTLSVFQNVSMYGGLAVFSGLVLWDTKKIIAHAEGAYGARQLSPINDSLGIYLDFINLFIRILFIMDNRRRK
jgi:FtsH-binding integral membrane protein